MEQHKFYTPTNDVIFHCLFGAKGQEKITKALLEGLLKREVQELNLDLNLDFMRSYFEDKKQIADVRAQDKDKNNYILEMQNRTNAFLPKRFLSYACKSYIAELKCSEDYSTLKKVAIIVIMMESFPKCEEIEEYHTVWNFREKVHPNHVLLDDMEIHIIEVQKYLKQKQNGGTIEPWIELIVNPKGKEVEEAMKKYKTIQEAVDELNRLNANDEVRD